MQRGKKKNNHTETAAKKWSEAMKNRDKAQKEVTKPVVGCDTEKKIYWLMGIEWDSEGSENSQLLKDWKEIWIWQKNKESLKVVFSCLQFSFALFCWSRISCLPRIKLNPFPHAESFQFIQTT